MEDALILVGLGLVSLTAVSVVGSGCIEMLMDLRQTCASLDARKKSRDEHGIDSVMCETSQLGIVQYVLTANTWQILTTMMAVCQDRTDGLRTEEMVQRRGVQESTGYLIDVVPARM